MLVCTSDNVRNIEDANDGRIEALNAVTSAKAVQGC